MLLWTWRCGYLFNLVFLFPLDIFPEVALLSSMEVLFLIFLETSILFSLLPASNYNPINSEWGFPFLPILASICYPLSFWWKPFWQAWGDISLWFWFAFPLWLVMLSAFFMYLLVIRIPSLEKYLFRSFYIGFLIYLFLLLSCMSFLYTFNINPLTSIQFANIFFPFYKVVFSFC